MIATSSLFHGSDLHVGAGNDMAGQPPGVVPDGRLVIMDQARVKVAGRATENVENGPPVGRAMLVLVAVGKGVEEWEE